MRLSILAVAALMSVASLAHASDITYNVSESAGGATAVGTVTTDGTIGVLGPADIVGYTFTVSDGGAPVTYSEGVLVLDGSDLTATASGLFFNFSDPSYAGVVFGDDSLSNFLCDAAQGATCSGNAASIEISVDGTPSDSGVFGGDLQIGSAVGATPEPSSLILLGSGLVGLAGAARRRFIK